MKPEFAKKILNKVTADYNRIAPLWSIKRWKVPTDILALEKYIEDGDNILDLGCGNGYLFELFKDKNANYTGADVSEGQIKICKTKYPNANFIVTQPLSLPFKEGEFDKIFCLSTIHHIPSNELRLKFLATIKKSLKDGGILILTAWNTTSEMFNWWQQNKNQFVDKNEFDEGDILYPFKNSEGKSEIDRYVHCFTKEEIREILTQSGFDIQEINVVSRGNGKFQNIIALAKNRH